MTHRQPLLLGIVNVTPDSFSDGGLFHQADKAIAHGLSLLDQGADAIDVGGESTRPGAPPVDVNEECRRVLPVIRGLLAARPQAKISIDTAKARVAREALEAGAWMVNDVTAGRDPQMFSVCASAEGPVVLMHMRGKPATMQRHTEYDDLVGEVIESLKQRLALAVDAGVQRQRLIADPGLGFGKAVAGNAALVRALPRIRQSLGVPVLIGASRKSFIGALTGQSRTQDRQAGSLGAALAAAHLGADWLRVHDVAATRDALVVFSAFGGLR